MVTDLGVRGTGKPAKDVDRARATPMGRGLCTRALCREKGTAPLLGAQGHQAHQAHACIRTDAYQKCTQQRKPGSSCASDANIDAGASTPAQGIQAGCVGIPHMHTHNDMRAADARHTYLALPLLLVALGWAADGRWWASGSPAPAPRGGDVALEAVAAALLPRLKETATRSPSDMARRLREGGGGWAKRTAA